jgi:23S rRNA pseudouridine2457 synthase
MAIFALNKPFGFLSQFSDEGNRQGLGALGLGLSRDVYPIGRLDADSEGLLLLSDEREMNGRLLDPRRPHWRTYWVQVEGAPTPEQLKQLSAPMELRIQGQIRRTLPARARLCSQLPALPERNPPIRYRASIPTAWVELGLQEGKNRQVRRMTAAVGLPTLRLIRVAWGNLQLLELGLAPGEVRALTEWEQKILLEA